MGKRAASSWATPLTMPAWLTEDAPHADVVLSSRVRVMRNLRGFRFVHRAAESELLDIRAAVLAAAPDTARIYRNVAETEHQFLLGSRLVSPEFDLAAPGRALLIDPDHSASVMVNEEDHVRIQAITGGWLPQNAEAIAEGLLRALDRGLDYAWSPRFGYLAASPYNAGEGLRMSAMFHLIGLAHTKRLPSVLKALSLKGLASRGLFGEASRAVGAFLQVSVIGLRRTDFVGACDYLVREEREARRDVGRIELAERAKLAIDYAISSPVITASDAFRVLGWARWAAVAGVDGIGYGHREVDAWLTTIEIRGEQGNDRSARARATFLRGCLEAK